MKFSWNVALCAFLLSGCAGLRSTPDARSSFCTPEAALARGQSDGASGHRASLAFLSGCEAESRAAARKAYRAEFAKFRAARRAAAQEAKEEIAAEAAEESDEAETASASTAMLPPPVRQPSALSWVCEIEASSRVFTGAGETRNQALDSARATCGSHFQAASCTKADCKQNL